MSRTLRIALRRSTALLLLSLAVGLTFGAPLHARHDAGDPTHQRACVVVAWTKALQTAAATPPAALALAAACGTHTLDEPQPSTPELSRLAPQARAPPLV